jgi:hypothetical protein
VPKPQLAEMKAFASIMDAADIGHCERADSETALIVPAHLDTSYPFTSPRDRRYLAQALHQAYVSADILVHRDGTRFAWLVSQAAEPVAVKPQLTAGLRLCALDGDAAKGEVTLVRSLSVFSVSQAGKRALAGREAR